VYRLEVIKEEGGGVEEDLKDSMEEVEEGGVR